jgi:hypothetical protein
MFRKIKKYYGGTVVGRRAIADGGIENACEDVILHC